MKKLILLTLIVVAFIGCSKDEPDLISLPLTEKTLNYGDEYQIEATSKSLITYKSSDDYFATINELGLIKAGFVGEANITLSNLEDTKNFKVTIEPKSTLYQEPQIKFGISKSDIIQKYGIPDSQSADMMLYEENSAKTPVLFFAFSGETLISYGLIVNALFSSELGKFLGERYKLISVDSEDYSFVFMNALVKDKATMLVGTTPYSSAYWMVAYISTGLTKSAYTHTNMIAVNDLKSRLNQFRF